MKISSIFIFFLFITTINGQSVILLEQDTISEIHESLSFDFALPLYFKNNTNDSIAINWRREFVKNCPPEWYIATADPLLSYVYWINESPTPIPILPDGSSYSIAQLFYPNKIAGCCDVKMIFYVDGEPNNPIDTGYYHIEINATGCYITSSTEEIEEVIHLYPNPSSDIINIENNSALGSITLYDLKGNTYFKRTLSVPNKIDISSFPRGIYICKIKTKQGHYLTAKILKQ